jgi:hypothetical protein
MKGHATELEAYTRVVGLETLNQVFRERGNCQLKRGERVSRGMECKPHRCKRKGFVPVLDLERS